MIGAAPDIRLVDLGSKARLPVGEALPVARRHTRAGQALFLFFVGAAAAACSPVAAGSAPRSASPARPVPRWVVEVTEPDATVGAALSPLVLSAGPSVLFVPSSSARCPVEMALVADRVCVDRWEATVTRLEAGKEVPLSPYLSLDHLEGTLRAQSSAGVVPQGYISGHQAERACRAAGKRLCTSTEWELGCRGPKGTQFPYGAERRAKACNDDVRSHHPVVEATHREGLPGNKAWLDGMNLAVINQLPDTLAKSGERSECVTSDGLYDMVGNLHEWVADADGTFRGGYYMDTTRNGDGCSYQTTAHDFEYHDYSTGFRCCADPETIE